MALVLFFPDARLIPAMLLAGLVAVPLGRLLGGSGRLLGLLVLFLTVLGYLMLAHHPA